MQVLKMEYGLLNGDLIKAIVKARNADGWSNFSDVSTGAILVQSQPILAPSFTSYTRSMNSVSLNWN